MFEIVRHCRQKHTDPNKLISANWSARYFKPGYEAKTQIRLENPQAGLCFRCTHDKASSLMTRTLCNVTHLCAVVLRSRAYMPCPSLMGLMHFSVK